MKIYGTKEEISEYYNSEALSQSRLKKLNYGVKSFVNNKGLSEEEEGIIIGSLVDAMLTRNYPLSEEYYISTLESKPGDTVLKIIKDFYKTLSLEELLLKKDLENPDYKEQLLDIAVLNNAYSTYGKDAKLKKIYEGSAYFAEIVNSLNKQVISLEEHTKALNIAESLKRLPFIQKCLNISEENKNEIVYFQKPIYFEFKGVKCKALPDIVYINKEKKICFILDIKTTFENTFNFLYIINKLRYDIQAAFYMEACKSYGMERQNFMFAVESTTYIGNPLILIVDKDILNRGLKGSPALIVEDVALNTGWKGIEELIELYKFYEENGFDEEKMVKISKPYRTLNISLKGISV